MQTPKETHANIRLDLDVKYDDVSKMHFARFAMFPQVVAYDDTEDKAVQRLVTLFNEEVLKDRKEEIISKLLEFNNLQVEPKLQHA